MFRKEIEGTIKLHIDENETVFVFPSQNSADIWADYACSFSGRSAVAMERFLSWDKFKGESIKSQHKNLTSIPSAMRSIFATKITEENKTAPFFKSIINPSYAKTASAFSSWIEGILPSLEKWEKVQQQLKDKDPSFKEDEEDEDLHLLHKKYEDFLKRNSLFDPSWETPPFISDGRKYIIFYPEILMDWYEYKNLLENPESEKYISLVHINPCDCKKSGTVEYFTNTRSELRNIALYLREKHEKEKIPWTSMALSVPELEDYESYIERELSIHEIPFTFRNGHPLAFYGAGHFFEQVKECVESSFSFESVKSLLFNFQLPWIKPSYNREIVAIGKKYNCLVSFKDKNDGKFFDSWEEAFIQKKKDDAKDGKEDIVLESYFKKLKKSLKAFTCSESFSQITKAWFAFRTEFLDMTKIKGQSDKVLGRCLAELSSLIDLEKEFGQDATLSSPFSFFIDYLKDKNYLSQSEENGVQILPYRVAAMTPYKVHVLMNAGQAQASVIFKQLSFLSDDKRSRLGFTEDPDVSDLFIALYGSCPVKESHFTCSAKTLTGYALSYPTLKEEDRRKSRKEGIKYSLPDEREPLLFYQEEKEFLKSFSKEDGEKTFPEKITETQLKSFLAWKEMKGINDKELEEKEKEKLSEKINEKTLEKVFTEGHSKNPLPEIKKYNINASDLSLFYDCPRKFLLKKILKTDEENNEAELIDKYTMGNIHHEALKNFLNILKERSLPLVSENEELPPLYQEFAEEACEKTIKEYTENKMSPMARKVSQAVEEEIKKDILEVIGKVSKTFEGLYVYGTEDWLSWNPENKDYRFNGKYDCIFYDNEGERYLVDFKNSNSSIPKNFYSTENELPAPQMPLYFLMAEKGENKISIQNCLYYDIKEGKTKYVFGKKNLPRRKKGGENFIPVYLIDPSPDESIPEEDSEKYKILDYRPTIKKVEEMAESYLSALKTSSFTPSPQMMDEQVCRQCTYRAFCRTTFNVSGEKIKTKEEDKNE